MVVNVKDYQGISFLWHQLKEVMYGEVSNWITGKYDYKLAAKYRPDYMAFTLEDLLYCTSIEDLPDDWRKLAEACIEKYDIKP